ncbi:hypothetical protein SDC9_146226 [bioreactor metagenome]|uniref:Uncharacterized protein n=1 Tax=bioreactor metagenome TaxID=1076179 RepID=A0A645EBI0_9ZZZZ
MVDDMKLFFTVQRHRLVHLNVASYSENRNGVRAIGAGNRGQIMRQKLEQTDDAKESTDTDNEYLIYYMKIIWKRKNQSNRKSPEYGRFRGIRTSVHVCFAIMSNYKTECKIQYNTF